MAYLVVYSGFPIQTIIIASSYVSAYKFALKFVGNQTHTKLTLKNKKEETICITENIVLYKKREAILDNKLYAPMVLMEEQANEAGDTLGTLEYASKFLYKLACNIIHPIMAKTKLSDVTAFKSSLVGKSLPEYISICQEYIAKRVREKEHQNNVQNGTKCRPDCDVCIK